MEADHQDVCPHCGLEMVRWENPPLSTWTGDFQYVCFNDECPYFVRGWEWMRQSLNVNASYRFRLDPETGETGALAVWSKDALKGAIQTKEKSVDAD